MTDQITPTTTETTLAIGPLVQVVFGANSAHHTTIPVFPFSDLALPGDDAATISDDDLITRVARWMDLPVSDFENMKVRRPATGSIVLIESPSYGMGTI